MRLAERSALERESLAGVSERADFQKFAMKFRELWPNFPRNNDSAVRMEFLTTVENQGGDVPAAALHRAAELRALHGGSSLLISPPPPEAVIALTSKLAELVDALRDSRASLGASKVALEAMEKEARTALNLLETEARPLAPAALAPAAKPGALAGTHPPPDALAGTHPPPDALAGTHPPPDALGAFFQERQALLDAGLAGASTLAQACDGLFDQLAQTVRLHQTAFPTEPACVAWCVRQVRAFASHDFFALALPEAPGCLGSELTELEWAQLGAGLRQALLAADKGADAGLGLGFVFFLAARPRLQAMIQQAGPERAAEVFSAHEVYCRELLVMME
jgi:hypothetical protein